MPDFRQSLEGQDFGFLQIIAELWGFVLASNDTRGGMEEITEIILQRKRVEDMADNLPKQAGDALQGLFSSGGRFPWARFTRQNGEIREMGPGRRDREQPYLNPISATEMLWYHALISRGFFETADGLEEYAYIPDDLYALLPYEVSVDSGSMGRKANKREVLQVIRSNDWIFDNACTLLAGVRIAAGSQELSRHWVTDQRIPFPLMPDELKLFFYPSSILTINGTSDPEKVRVFLEASRGEALFQLAKAWMDAPDYNDLHMVPGLRIEGEWHNDPLTTRRFVLDQLVKTPPLVWWSMPSFVEAVRQEKPDFQRPSGDYDSWYIRDEQSGEYLRGFEHWDDVDGALLRYIIAGPLYWLGMVDVAASFDGLIGNPRQISAFRVTKWGSSMMNGHPPQIPETDPKKIHVRSDGRLGVPASAPRDVRYQVARFCHWDQKKDDTYTYRITPDSLERAAEQGVQLTHILNLLKRNAVAFPPSLEKSLQRWDGRGVETRFEGLCVLRVSHPEIIQSLKR